MHRSRSMWIFFCALIGVAISSGIHETVFNNYLDDIFRISAETRGKLEFPRELPGFMLVVMTGLLAVLPVARLGMVGAATMGVGLIGITTIGNYFYPMVGMMVSDQHRHAPIASRGASIAIGLSDDHNRGKRLGQKGAVETIGVMLGTGFVWLFFKEGKSSYTEFFLWGALFAFLGAVAYGFLHIPHLHQPRSLRHTQGIPFVLSSGIVLRSAQA